MPTTLPELTRTIDNAFVTTWYEIRTEAIDQILDATPIWAVLNQAGCMTPQEGSDLITRTLRYGEVEATEIEDGDLLPIGEEELETMAIWRFKTIASHVQRSLFDDQKNRGPSKIKDLVGLKLSAARDGLEQKYEADVLGAFKSSETTKTFQGLNDMVPPIANRTTGNYGGIARPSAYVDSGNGVFVPDTTGTNPWWGPKYLPGVLATIEENLLDDLRKLYNSCHNNQSPPNLIITTQSIFETYELFAQDLSQIIKDASTMLADLGFEVLRFKGKPLIWTPNMTTGHVLMLNTDFIEVVYDPGFWFDMTDWKPIPREPKRIAHIVCFANMISTQLRRHGRLEYS